MAEAAGRGRRPSRFTVALGAVTVAALAGRVAYVLVARRHTVVWGDSFSYHYGANLLAQGKGFIDPLRYLFFGITTPSAFHPPVYTVYLALWSKLGVDSVLGHRLVSCLLGAAVVAVVGLIGRELAPTPASRDRIGLAAAAIAAVTPALWVNDAALMSEPAAELAAALAVLALLRFRARPSARGAAVAGVWCAVAALSRAELVLLFPLLALPVLRWAGAGRSPRSWVPFVAFAGAGVLIVGAWVGYNFSRFEKHVYITAGFGATLGGGACKEAFSGRYLGYRGLADDCGPAQIQLAVPQGVDPRTPRGHAEIEALAQVQLAHEGDESVHDKAAEKFAIDYFKAHRSELPGVLAARAGRTWGVFRPWQSATLDATIEGRGFTAARMALIGYWILALPALGGLWLLWRRRQAVAPFLAIALVVTAAAAVSFGVQRYRAPFDAMMPALAAVALSTLWSHARPTPTGSES